MEQNKNEMPKVTEAKTDEIFNLIETKDGVQITIGNYLVTHKKFKNIKNAENYLTKKPYELLINLMCLVTNQILKQNENNKETNENA